MAIINITLEVPDSVKTGDVIEFAHKLATQGGGSAKFKGHATEKGSHFAITCKRLPVFQPYLGK